MNNRKWLKFLANDEGETEKFNPKLSLLTENVFDDLDLTHLSEGQLRLLMEGRKDNVLKKYGELIDGEAMETIINFDEQYNYKHLNWMAKQLIKDSTVDYMDDQNEHVDTLVSVISDFVRYKQGLKKKAIEQYESAEDILNAIKAEIIEPRIEKARKKRESNPVARRLFNAGEGSNIYEDERYFVVRPDSTEASCYFGSKTKWCISQAGNSYFSQYTNGEGKIFYFIKDDTKKNDDKGYKMAIEISQTSNEIYFNTIWDRFDDPTEVGSNEAYDLANALNHEFGMPEETAEVIADEIHQHAHDNPPESPVAEFADRVDKGEWDGGFVTISAHYEDYDEYPYVMITAEVQIIYKIKNEKLIEMLGNDEIDISEAEEKLVEAFEGEGTMYEALDDAVDIGASKWWWPNGDNRDDPIAIDIDKEGSDGDWRIKISIGPFEDTDTGGSYSAGNLGEAESFCDYMKEEWGERNEMEIMEVLENNLIRYIPEIGMAQAEKWREARSQFTNGTHELIGGHMWYDVDDDEDDGSDLNLHMKFVHELNPDFVKWVFKAKEITNTQGNKVQIADVNIGSAAKSLSNVITRTGVGPIGFLQRSIYNVYQKAKEFSSRQLKLDFGTSFDLDDELELPTVPEDLSVNISFSQDTLQRFQKSENILPSPAYVEMMISIYIPFHKSESELKALINMFLYVRDKYDQINTYMLKYLKDYVDVTAYFDEKGMVHQFPVPPGHEDAMAARTKKVINVVNENLYLNIVDSQMLIESIDEELREYRRQLKEKAYS